METKKEVLSFFDYNVGDKVEYGGEKYVVTNVSIDKSDATGFTGYAGLAHINADGTYNNQAELFIESPTQALMIEDTTDPNATVMDFDKIGSSLNDWASFTNSFNSSVPKAGEHNGFKKLINAGLEGGFVASFDKNISSLISALNQAAGTMNNSLDNMGQEDDIVQNDGDASLGGGRPSRTSDDYSKSSTPDTTSTQLVDNAKTQLEQYKKMSMNDLSLIAQNLNKLGIDEGKTVDELLTNTKYSEKVKNIILKNQNTSEELKKLIEAGEINITQKILLSMFNGTNPSLVGLNDNTVISLKQYLNDVAAKNNLDLNNLINDSNNTNLLKNSLKEFSNVSKPISTMNDSTVNEELLKIYDGNTDVSSSSMNIIRNYVDQIAQSNQTDAEILLTTNNTISNDIQNLGKSSVFTSTLANYQGESITAVLNSLFKN